MPFKKGNIGRPIGTKNVKTKEWEKLSDSISERHSEEFNKYMDKLWAGSMEDQHRAALLFLQVLKYFKPKMSNIQSTMNELETVSKVLFVDAKPSNN